MTEPGKALRADGQRNRIRVVEVAEAAFATDGLAVPISEIARRAEVSTGTVSRHFPTKAALVEAVLLTVLERLGEEARALVVADDPGQAFFSFFKRLVLEGTTNKALFDTLAAAGPDSDLKSAVASAGADLTAALGDLLVRAQHTGDARPDITVDDLSAILVGALAMQAHTNTNAPSHHLADLATDTLRTQH
jgi:AcrR family transcriptional regulator